MGRLLLHCGVCRASLRLSLARPAEPSKDKRPSTKPLITLTFLFSAPQFPGLTHSTAAVFPRRALSVTTDRIFVRQKDVPEEQK